jgi:hypothetical protein
VIQTSQSRSRETTVREANAIAQTTTAICGTSERNERRGAMPRGGAPRVRVEHLLDDETLQRRLRGRSRVSLSADADRIDKDSSGERCAIRSDRELRAYSEAEWAPRISVVV